MTKPDNSRKRSFFASIPRASLDDDSNNITSKCKFNFSFMDFSQSAGQKFLDWSPKKLNDLLSKLINFSNESLDYWKNQRIGKKNSKVLEIYIGFPHKSDFTHPKHVPHQAAWARFRIGSKERLIGFVIPEDYSNKTQKSTGIWFDCNTFYIVFLDENHNFCK